MRKLIGKYFRCLLGVVIFLICLFGPGCDGKLSRQPAMVLAARCVSDEIRVRIYADDITVYNEFSRKANGETIHCYDFTYKIRRADGSKVAGAFGGVAFRYRIAIVIRGDYVEVVDFQAL